MLQALCIDVINHDDDEGITTTNLNSLILGLPSRSDGEISHLRPLGFPLHQD